MKKMVWLAISLALLALACDKMDKVVDSSRPEVIIVEPKNGAVFDYATTVTIKVAATDDRKVDRVELYIDGEYKTLNDAPYEYQWKAETPGWHTLQAKAYDAQDNWRETDEVRFQVVVPERDNMFYIPAGEFTMGSNNAYNDESPVHTVYLDAYYMDKYEVTNAQYEEFMKATERSAPEHWNDSQFNAPVQPVVGVTWKDAEAYCKWAGKRLPTEAEWEKAARGTDGRKYPWGNERPTCEYAVTDLVGSGCGENRTWSVGSKPKGVSPYGVHDMAGNVWEWVNDWYDSEYYSKSPNRNPTGPNSGTDKGLRGGSWYTLPLFLRAALRSWSNPDLRDVSIGFRCSRAQ